MTTATALTNCRLLQFSATDLGLSAADLMREFVRAELYATQGSNPSPNPNPSPNSDPDSNPKPDRKGSNPRRARSGWPAAHTRESTSR